jgi:LacI family repressor for deo operon, udp, cdd, tsx, nupC, and nupG
MIFSKEADGVLSFSGSLPAQDEIPRFRHLKQPPVVVGFEFIEPQMQTFPSVHIDNMAAARQATDYLISMGHRRIGFIGSTSEHYYANERDQAYRAAIQAAGLPIIEDLIAHCDVSIEESRKCTRRLLHLPERPTAIFCGGGDDMAIGAIHEIKSAGLKVPQDLSVIGFDDIRYAGVCDPPLTTIAQPAEEIGEKCMYRLCAMIEGGEVDQSPWILPHKLIIRNSVAPLSDGPTRPG